MKGHIRIHTHTMEFYAFHLVSMLFLFQTPGPFFKSRFWFWSVPWTETVEVGKGGGSWRLIFFHFIWRKRLWDRSKFHCCTECLEQGQVPENEEQRMIHLRKVNQVALACMLQKANMHSLNNRQFIAPYNRLNCLVVELPSGEAHGLQWSPHELPLVMASCSSLTWGSGNSRVLLKAAKCLWQPQPHTQILHHPGERGLFWILFTSLRIASLSLSFLSAPHCSEEWFKPIGDHLLCSAGLLPLKIAGLRTGEWWFRKGDLSRVQKGDGC